MIAALFVEPGGPYFGVPGVDPWDRARDARGYAGPHPVVAHPPCARWCCLAALNEKRYGYTRGQDGGCFWAALSAVRRFGGVIEHPAYSAAWAAFDLPRPMAAGGWTDEDPHGGRSAHVEQGRYGAPSRKRTWVYAQLNGAAFPELLWGMAKGTLASVSFLRNRRTPGMAGKREISKREASVTPAPFRDALLAMARSAEVAS